MNRLLYLVDADEAWRFVVIVEATQPRLVSLHEIRAGRARGGFTVVEYLIVFLVLIILATLVIPQFSRAGQQDKQASVRESLHFLRTQIAVFKAQHQDVPPGYPEGNPGIYPTPQALVDQLTQHTDIACRISAPDSLAYPYGPYMKDFPVNPLNGLKSVEMVGDNLAMPQPDGKTGWIYMPQTQEIIANVTGKDASGTPYSSY